MHRTIEDYIADEKELEDVVLPDNIEHILEKYEKKVYRDVKRKRMKGGKRWQDKPQ